MPGLQNRQWVVAEHPTTELREEHFAYREEAVRDLDDGEVLLKTHFLNVAPVMRMYMMKDGAAGEAPLSIGDVIHGRGVAEVVASKHPEYREGEFIQGQIGWQTYKISSMTEAERIMKLKPRGIPAHYALAVLGMTGFSAYFGFLTRGEPVKGDRVLISGAVGGVGSLVIQLARISGCGQVVGIAGGKDKCHRAIELGCDDCIDYQHEDVVERIAELFPDGIDLYFDNVGGEILEAALDNLAHGSRVVLCGSISEYQREVAFGPTRYTKLRGAEADMRGFFVYNHSNNFDQAEDDLADWMVGGKLVPLIDMVDGFESMPGALMDMFVATKGGKRLVNIIGGDPAVI